MGSRHEQNKVILPFVYFFANLEKPSFDISELFYSHHIKHNFIFSTEIFLLSIQDIRDIEGYEKIKDYIMSYEYVFDLRG